MSHKYGMKRVLREVRLGNGHQHGVVWNGNRGCFEHTEYRPYHLLATLRSLEYAAQNRKMGHKDTAREWVELAKTFRTAA